MSIGIESPPPLLVPKDCSRQAPRQSASGLHRLVKIGDQVLGVFDAYGEPDDVRTGSGLDAVFVGKLPVGGGGGVEDEAPRVADIGEVAEDANAVHQLHAGLVAALQPEGEH